VPCTDGVILNLIEVKILFVAFHSLFTIANKRLKRIAGLQQAKGTAFAFLNNKTG